MPKNKILIFDVETIGLQNLSIFDIGFTMIDMEKGTTNSEGFLIDEVYNSNDFSKAYYYNLNKDKYKEQLENNEISIISVADMKKKVLDYLTICNLAAFGAFNVKFDIKALNYTFQKFGVAKKQLTYDIINKFTKIIDVSLAFGEVESKSSCYRCWCKRNNGLKPTGNVKTDVETIYRYILNRDFKEAHRGKEDTEVEAGIYMYSYANDKDKDTFIDRVHNLTMRNKQTYKMFQ